MNKNKLYFLKFAKIWIIYSLCVCVMASIISFSNFFFDFIIDNILVSRINDIIILSFISAVLYLIGTWYVKKYE